MEQSKRFRKHETRSSGSDEWYSHRLSCQLDPATLVARECGIRGATLNQQSPSLVFCFLVPWRNIWPQPLVVLWLSMFF